MQVLESSKIEIEVAQILKRISLSNIKTIKSSIDERDALTRALEQNPEIFYSKNQNNDQKYGLVKNKVKNQQSTNSTLPKGTRRNPEVNPKTVRNSANNRKNNSDPAYSPNSTPDTSENHEKTSKNGVAKSFKKRKESTERARKLSNDDFLSPETPLIGVNFKDYINEEKFNKLGIHLQV